MSIPTLPVIGDFDRNTVVSSHRYNQRVSSLPHLKGGHCDWSTRLRWSGPPPRYWSRFVSEHGTTPEPRTPSLGVSSEATKLYYQCVAGVNRAEAPLLGLWTRICGIRISTQIKLQVRHVWDASCRLRGLDYCEVGSRLEDDAQVWNRGDAVTRPRAGIPLG